MLDRIKAVKNHVLLTLDEVKSVQAEQFKNDAQLNAQNRQDFQTLKDKLQSAEAGLKELNAKLDQAMQAIARLSRDNQALSQSMVTDLASAAHVHKTELAAMVTPLHGRFDLLNERFDLLGQRFVNLESLLPALDTISDGAMNSEFLRSSPEVCLLLHMRSFLLNDVAVDIGANVGDVSQQLLNQGYKVIAFEPNEHAFEKLTKNLRGCENFQAYKLAVGQSDDSALLYTVAIEKEQRFKYHSDPTVYSTLVKHALPEEMRYVSPVEVEVKRIPTLHSEGILPKEVAILKVDTEGNDINVVSEITAPAYDIVMTEYWDKHHYFAVKNHGLLTPIVEVMRAKGYKRHIVIYRVLKDGASSAPRFCCNFAYSVDNSWGNVLFFKDQKHFDEAYRWCSSSMKEIHLFQ